MRCEESCERVGRHFVMRLHLRCFVEQDDEILKHKSVRRRQEQTQQLQGILDSRLLVILLGITNFRYLNVRRKISLERESVAEIIG